MGIHMTRSWWRNILPAWLLVQISSGALILYMLADWPVIALLLFWLFIPFYDTLLLHIVSRCVFSAAPSFSGIMQQLPTLLFRQYPRLILRRLIPSRSFLLPVWLLENQKGPAARARGRILRNQGGGGAIGLTFMFLLLQMVVIFSLMNLLPVILPEGLGEQLLDRLIDEGFVEDHIYWIFAFSYQFAVLVLEPFYVTAGFSLYLNRRTILEAWDIELNFRKMARRVAETTAAVMLALLLSHTAMSPTDAFADSPPQTGEKIVRTDGIDAAPRRQIDDEYPLNAHRRNESEAKSTIAAVMDEPEFDEDEEYDSWRFDFDSDEDNEERVEGPDLGLGKFMARVVELALWATLVMAIILAIVFRDRWLPLLGIQRRVTEKKKPTTLAGLDVRPESLPSDIPAEAQRLWNLGQYRNSMSLLYRGALSYLLHHASVTFRESQTEGECLALVRETCSERQSETFERLTHGWIMVAYAHDTLSDENAASLIAGWRSAFGERL